MYHQLEDFVTTTDDIAPSAARLQNVEAEVYGSFLNFMEALSKPYAAAGGSFDGSMYEKLMPIAAQLTYSACTLAAVPVAEDESQD